MLTPEQSRAYEVLSVGAVSAKGHTGTQNGSSSMDSRRLDESCDLQEIDMQTTDFGNLPKKV